MARSKGKAASPFAGLWHIVSMDEWDEDYFNEEVQAFIEFEVNGTGQFQFGYVSGYMDCRPTTRDGVPAVEWTWEGGTALTARKCQGVAGQSWGRMNCTA
jgi:hypothetical protein